MAQHHETRPMASIATESIVTPKHKKISDPPPIAAYIQFKWGLSLLGEERAKEYLTWLYEKIQKRTE